MHLAEIALSPGMRERLLARNRQLIRDGYARLERWVSSSGGLLSISPPAATALGFVRYHLDVPSLVVGSRLQIGTKLTQLSPYWQQSHTIGIGHPPIYSLLLLKILMTASKVSTHRRRADSSVYSVGLYRDHSGASERLLRCTCITDLHECNTDAK